MSSSGFISTKVTSRYATALLGLAEEQNILSQIEADITALLTALGGAHDLADALQDPRSEKKDLDAVVVALSKAMGLQGITENFLRVLVQNGRIDIVGPVLEQTLRMLSEKRGEKTALVQVTKALSASQKKALEKELSQSSGSKVNLDIKINPDIMGGMIVTLDSMMIDNSVRRKLERLQMRMGHGANENTVQTLNEVG